MSVLDRFLCFILIHNGKQGRSSRSGLLKGEAALLVTTCRHAISGVGIAPAGTFQILIKNPDMVVMVYCLAATRICCEGVWVALMD